MLCVFVEYSSLFFCFSISLPFAKFSGFPPALLSHCQKVVRACTFAPTHHEYAKSDDGIRKGQKQPAPQ